MAMVQFIEFTINGVDVLTGNGDNYDKLGRCFIEDFSLEEQFLQPNSFNFTIRRQKVERGAKAIKFDVASDIIGKNVSCKLRISLNGKFNGNEHEDYEKFAFDGIIVSAALKGLNISCVAKSEDCKMTTIPHCNTFINQKLEDIVKAIWHDGYGGNADNIRPHYDKELPYVVQYNESDYDFIARLAKQYGEFFYFNEAKGLVFGKLHSSASIPLRRMNDFFDVQYELHTGNPNFAYVANHYAKEGVINSKVSGFTEGEGLYAKALGGSTPKQADQTNLSYDYPNLVPFDSNDTYLTMPRTLRNESVADNFVICRCLTYRLDVHVGSTVTFREDNDDHNNNKDAFIVISTQMKWDCNGSPTNEIVAMALPKPDTLTSNIYPPYFDVNAYPKSSAQRAVVIDNHDPFKMGRVMVQFAWQPPIGDIEKEKYPWIRIAQPYNGGNKNGCYILPEIGDEVMVGFEHDNMEKPFVIGTLYHDSKNEDQKGMPDEQWVETDNANKSNEVKAFRTKKGHTIEFHDVANDNQYGFIRIYGNEKKDQPNYDIILSADSVKPEGNNDENYKVTSASAEKDEGFEDYEAKELRIMVRSNGGDIVLDAGNGDIIMKANNIRLHATGDRTAYIEGNDIVKVKKEQDITVNLSNLQIDDSRYVIVKDEDFLQSKKLNFDINEDVLLSAKSLSMETSGKTEIKASDIAAEAQNTAKIIAKTGLELDGGSQSDLKGSNVNVEANVSAKVKGAQVDVNSSGPSTIKGSTILLDASTGTRKGTWTDL